MLGGGSLSSRGCILALCRARAHTHMPTHTHANTHTHTHTHTLRVAKQNPFIPQSVYTHQHNSQQNPHIYAHAHTHTAHLCIIRAQALLIPKGDIFQLPWCVPAHSRAHAAKPGHTVGCVCIHSFRVELPYEFEYAEDAEQGAFLPIAARVPPNCRTSTSEQTPGRHMHIGPMHTVHLGPSHMGP